MDHYPEKPKHVLVNLSQELTLFCAKISEYEILEFDLLCVINALLEDINTPNDPVIQIQHTNEEYLQSAAGQHYEQEIANFVNARFVLGLGLIETLKENGLSGGTIAFYQATALLDDKKLLLEKICTPVLDESQYSREDLERARRAAIAAQVLPNFCDALLRRHHKDTLRKGEQRARRFQEHESALRERTSGFDCFQGSFSAYRYKL